jgi:propionyl-CoA carboxylase alpha chain
VEFVVGKDEGFYFLEMNTRLQVEHPVTECITGLDLVEQMIRVAAGEKLGFAQADVKRDGWALECRINAEDPFRNFLPSTGRLVKFQAPPVTMAAAGTVPKDGGVRVDTGVTEGGEIPMFYDSMIAKLIVHGKDRNEAIAKMREALNGFVIRGISSNIPFQAALLAHPDFVAGKFNTGFIAQNWPQGFSAESVRHADAPFMVALAALVRRKELERAAGISGQLPGHEVEARDDYTALVHEADGVNTHHAVLIEGFDAKRGSARITVDGRAYELESASRIADLRHTGTVDGRPFVAQIDRGAPRNAQALRVSHAGARVDVSVVTPRIAELSKWMKHKAPPDTSKFLLSPMPGLLVQVAVAKGQHVQAGERLAVIEAMKMENILVAAQDGVVAELLAPQGESLAVDQPIIRFE